jgi:GDSL-like Lipase/Acylhydrolase
MKTPLFSILATTLAILSCGSVDIAPQQTVDVAVVGDYAKYISIGSNLTAGYADGGLYRTAQQSSFPSILALQLKGLGTAEFNQPLFTTTQANGTGYLEAQSVSPLSTTKVEMLSAIRSTSPLLYTKYTGLNNNFGVPNLRMMDVAKPSLGNPSKTSFNPFYERLLAESDLDKSYIDYVKAADFTFFTCEVGQNDVLQYAQSGGTGALSPIESFTMSCRQLFAGLTAKNAKGIVLNIANIEALPAFQKVASIKEKASLYIESNGSIRLATDDELVSNEVAAKIGKKHDNGSKYGLSKEEPIKNEDFLDSSELKRIKISIQDFNAVLAVEARAKSLKVLDINALYTTITNGSFTSGGMAVKGNISKEGFFSVDGIHPTPRGQAIIANEIIKVLNEELTAKALKNIALVDISKYKTLEIK